METAENQVSGTHLAHFEQHSWVGHLIKSPRNVGGQGLDASSTAYDLGPLELYISDQVRCAKILWEDVLAA